jgi:hypothetical protein
MKNCFRNLHVVVLAILFPCSLQVSSAADAAQSPSPAISTPRAATVWVVEAGNLSEEEKLALYCLQGIANRKGPRVFIRQGATCRWMDFQYHLPEERGGPIWNPATVGNFERKYRSIEDYWIDYFTGKGDLVFQKVTLPELVGRLGSEIKGSILYEALPTDFSPVATMAGLEDAVPLTPAMESALANQGVKLPVVFDYRKVRASFPQGSDLRLEAHRWTLEHLLSRCNKDGAVSRDNISGFALHDTINAVDLSVMNHWLAYNLNHLAAENGTDLTVYPNPSDIALLHRFFDCSLSPSSTPLPGTSFTAHERDALWKFIAKITPKSPDPRQKELLKGLLTRVIVGAPSLSQKELLEKLSQPPAAGTTVSPTQLSTLAPGDKAVLDKLIARITPAPPNPVEQALLEKLLSQINPFSPVYGWGKPEEQNFIRSINRFKLVGICSSVPNNSFFAALPASPASTFRQKGVPLDENSVTVEPKVYVAFMVNEGDTLKTANGLMGDGAWIQPERGTIPINWGIDPLLVRHFPALMGYYYSTMTDKDYFFAAASGWGYTHPVLLPQDALAPYAELVRKGGELSDVRFIDIWYVNGLKKNGEYYPFLKATGMKGLTLWSNEQSVENTDFGMTIINSNEYYTLKDPAKFADRLVSDMNGVKSPWFIVVYGAMDHGTPYKFAEVAKRLPTDRFKVVKLDEFFAAAKKAGAEMKGRVWRPGPNAPKGVAP